MLVDDIEWRCDVAMVVSDDDLIDDVAMNVAMIASNDGLIMLIDDVSSYPIAILWAQQLHGLPYYEVVAWSQIDDELSLH